MVRCVCEGVVHVPIRYADEGGVENDLGVRTGLGGSEKHLLF